MPSTRRSRANRPRNWPWPRPVSCAASVMPPAATTLRVWRVDHGYVSAAFGLARILLEEGDREAAVSILDEVPEASSQYLAAQVAAVRASLDAATGTLSEQDLLGSSTRLERLRLDAGHRATLAVEMLRGALDWLAGAGGPDRPESWLRVLRPPAPATPAGGAVFLGQALREPRCGSAWNAHTGCWPAWNPIRPRGTRWWTRPTPCDRGRWSDDAEQCPNCAEPVTGTDRYCERCGHDLTGADPSRPAGLRCGPCVGCLRPGDRASCGGCGGTTFVAEGYCEDCGGAPAGGQGPHRTGPGCARRRHRQGQATPPQRGRGGSRPDRGHPGRGGVRRGLLVEPLRHRLARGGRRPPRSRCSTCWDDRSRPLTRSARRPGRPRRRRSSRPDRTRAATHRARPSSAPW